MAVQIVPQERDTSIKDSPSKEALDQLQRHNWVCDYETHRTMWEAQCLLQLVDEAMGAGTRTVDSDMCVVQVAIQGIERLLAGAIDRTGFTALGPRWES